MKGHLTCELLIPFESLDIDTDKQRQLLYNVKLNGLPENSKLISSQQIGQMTVYQTPHGFLPAAKPNALIDLIYPTDFSATYTLY